MVREINLPKLADDVLHPILRMLRSDTYDEIKKHDSRIDAAETDIDILQGEVSGILDAVYPVGSVYTSVVSTNPATLFGGTWAAFATGRCLVGIDAGQAEFDTAEETGGEKTHTLTGAESGIAAHAHTGDAHTHSLSGHTHGSAAHTHTMKNHTHTGGAHEHGLNSHTHDISHSHQIGYPTAGAGSNNLVQATGYSGSIRSTMNQSTSTSGAASGNTASGGAVATGAPSDNTTDSTTPGSTGAPSNDNTGAATAGNTGTVAAANAANAHNNLQPYIVVYMWKRTA